MAGGVPCDSAASWRWSWDCCVGRRCLLHATATSAAAPPPASGAPAASICSGGTAFGKGFGAYYPPPPPATTRIPPPPPPPPHPCTLHPAPPRLPPTSAVTVQPGLIGGEVNRLLARHQARHQLPTQFKLGPDPASIDSAMVGGILANNASGMCCGVSQNSYHTLKASQGSCRWGRARGSGVGGRVLMRPWCPPPLSTPCPLAWRGRGDAHLPWKPACPLCLPDSPCALCSPVCLPAPP